jgi:hypothetical protein
MAKILNTKKPVETLDDIANDANSDGIKSEVELQHISIRVHPDLLKLIKKYAVKEHRMFSETVRDLIVTGLRTRGEL